MTLSPLQITPSQSKMNTSTPGSKSFAGSVNLSTFALRAVLLLLFADIILLFLCNDDDKVVEEEKTREDRLRAADGEKARAAGRLPDAASASANADLAMFMVNGGC